MDFNFYSKSQPYFHLVESSSSRNPRLIMTDAEATEMTHLGWSVELSFLVPFLGEEKNTYSPKKALAKMGEATPKIRLCTWEIWSPGHWICKEKALWNRLPFLKKKTDILATGSLVSKYIGNWKVRELKLAGCTPTNVPLWEISI